MSTSRHVFFPVQVNLEYLGRVVFNVDGVLYLDSVVGTDSHTTMINGLGILGWGACIRILRDQKMYTYTLLHCVGVGGIEAEAVMLGQAISMILPEVVGCKLSGAIGPLVTSTDVVLTITKVIYIHRVSSLSELMSY